MLNENDVSSGHLIHLFASCPTTSDGDIPRQDLIDHLDQAKIKYVIPTSSKYPFSVLINRRDYSFFEEYIKRVTDGKITLCITKW